MRPFSLVSRLSMLAVLLCAWSAAAQDVSQDLLREAEKAMQQAKEARAELLSPGHFEQAMEYYHEAEQELREGGKLEDIRSLVSQAVRSFQEATEATKLAEVTLQTPFVNRSKAVGADAQKYAGDTWKKAEAMFAEAASALEEGDVNEAKEEGAQAGTLYRQAELEAIKASYLNETWSLLKDAESMDVGDRAPKTLQRARDLAAQAEKELNQNRYDTDYPRSLALEARYEAKHAIHLSKTIKQDEEADKTFEDLYLTAEDPLREIASAMDMKAEFDDGLAKPAGRIVERILLYEDSVRTLAEVRQTVRQYRSELEGLATERSEIAEHLDALETMSGKILSIEGNFTREEAIVLRDGRDLIIRLVGLSFDVGKSVLKPEDFGLLTKVQQSIKMFPDSKISIRGHTDSHGGDELNMKLSQERADAVKSYLVANMDIDASMFEAVGYGETRPAANNETAEGRAQNRRIDVVLRPEVALTAQR